MRPLIMKGMHEHEVPLGAGLIGIDALLLHCRSHSHVPKTERVFEDLDKGRAEFWLGSAARLCTAHALSLWVRSGAHTLQALESNRFGHTHCKVLVAHRCF